MSPSGHEGCGCLLKMQVTDVQRPHMSIPKICDSGHKMLFTNTGGQVLLGHKVVFTNKGGYIQHARAGQITSFYRDHSVYRMEAQPLGSRPEGLTWPEK